MWAYQHSYLRERLQDNRTILGWIVDAKREYVHLEVQRASQREDGGILDPKMLTLPQQMKLNFESLHIFRKSRPRPVGDV